jgi:hypothetical protein
MRCYHGIAFMKRTPGGGGFTLLTNRGGRDDLGRACAGTAGRHGQLTVSALDSGGHWFQVLGQ